MNYKNLTHSEIVAKIKASGYFDIRELVSKAVFNRDGEKAWRYFDTRLLITLDNWVSIKELRRAMQSFYLRFYSYPRHAFNLINDVRHSGLRPFLSLTRKIFSL